MPACPTCSLFPPGGGPAWDLPPYPLAPRLQPICHPFPSPPPPSRARIPKAWTFLSMGRDTPNQFRCPKPSPNTPHPIVPGGRASPGVPFRWTCGWDLAHTRQGRGQATTTPGTTGRPGVLSTEASGGEGGQQDIQAPPPQQGQPSPQSTPLGPLGSRGSRVRLLLGERSAGDDQTPCAPGDRCGQWGGLPAGTHTDSL